MTIEQINQKKIIAHDRITEVVSKMDKKPQIDMDFLIEALSDIRDLVVRDEAN